MSEVREVRALHPSRHIHPQRLVFISEHLLSSPVPHLFPPLPFAGSVFVSLLSLFLEFSRVSF